MTLRKMWPIGLLAVTLIAGCGKKEEAPASAPSEAAPQTNNPSPSTAQAKKDVDQATAGTISGKVIFQGTPPKQEVIDRSSDPACLKTVPGDIMSASVIANPNNTLRNVFVYIKQGLSGYTFSSPATPKKLEQKGCWYLPHVQGIQVGQTLEIYSDDPTLHNIHALPQENSEFNDSQKEGVVMKHVFNVPESPFKIKCDVHPWMSAYLGVVDNPYYAVTGDDGTFELKNVPPGTYVLEAWHEEYNSQTQTVTLGSKETKTIDFTFKAEQ